ncbi:MAG: 30S ribosomal protein S21 [Planctomycetes bacterium]|nr:30S ribosomal protein S21 [Planctomycetota bacterium]
MAIRIKARAGESAEQLLRRFKKICEKEGLTKEVKKRQYYEKPSERKRREVRRGPPRELGRPGSTAVGAGSRDGGRSGGAGGRAGAKSKSKSGGRGMSRGRSE